MDQALRKWGKGLLEGLGGSLARTGVSPNMISFLSLLVGLAAAFLIAAGQFVPAALLLLFAGLLDGLDGTVARLSGKVSRFGSLLDSVFDKVSEIAVLSAFYFFNPALALPVLLSISSMMLSSYVSKHVAALHPEKTENKSFYYLHTLAQRAERTLLIMAALLLPAYLVEILYLYFVLVGLSFLLRLVSARDILR